MSKDKFENSWAMGNDDEERDTVTLTLEDNSELECLILTTMEVEGNQYIALLPLDEDGEDEQESTVYLYRMVIKGENDIELINIEDDAEYEKASEAFDEYLDSLEFDEVFGEE